MSTALLEPDAFYFGLLDAPVSRRRGDRRDEIRYAFESVLPCVLESVHFETLPMSDGRLLAVGIDRTVGASYMGTHSRLAPSAVPGWLGLDQVDQDRALERLNLLTGPLTPVGVSKLRASILSRAVLLCAVLCVLVCLLAEQRVRVHRDAAGVLRSGTEALYTSAIPESLGGVSQSPRAILASEIRSLRSTRREERGVVDAPWAGFGADQAASVVLEAFPEDLELRLVSLSTAPLRTEMVVLAPGVEQATLFLERMGRAPEVRVLSSETRSQRDDVRVTLTLGLREGEP